MAKRELYKISGHWDHYLDGMFVLGDPHDETKECFALRPMTCPFQYQVFLNRARSYRDLPMRLGETSTLFRNEDSGEMHGLIRVRQFTISEGHLILRPDQLEEEFKGCLELAKYCLGHRRSAGGLHLPLLPVGFQQYRTSTSVLRSSGMRPRASWSKILDHLGIKYTIGIDEAAFYGPKLDIQYKNVFGKEDTLVTIQIDQLLAEQFGMYYIDAERRRRSGPTSSTAPPSAATSAPWPTSSRSTPAPCPPGFLPPRWPCCPSPTVTSTMSMRSRRPWSSAASA